MSEQENLPASLPPGIAYISKDGRRISKRGHEAQQAARARGNQTLVARVSAAKESEVDENAIRNEVRRIALKYLPAAVKHTAMIATGRVPNTPTGTRIAATKLLGEFGQVQMEARAGSGASVLAEMSLSDLEQSLRSAADAARDLAAIEHQEQSGDPESEPDDAKELDVLPVGAALESE